MNDAFFENDIAKMEHLRTTQGLKLPGDGNFHIDVATDEGNLDMVKYLVTKHGCKPSLYAKQMAHINGHPKTAIWLDKFGQERNQVDIGTIHRRFDKSTGVHCWSDEVPTEYRY